MFYITQIEIIVVVFKVTVIIILCLMNGKSSHDVFNVDIIIFLICSYSERCKSDEQLFLKVKALFAIQSELRYKNKC